MKGVSEVNERNDDSSPASCSTCRFYYRKTEQEHHAWIDEYGCKQERTHETETRLCRRFPQHVWHYPGDWCGEYRPSNDKHDTSSVAR
jgi:hypothetical protein